MVSMEHEERITKFRSSIARLISDCNKVVSDIDSLQSAIDEIERLKLAAVEETKRVQELNIIKPEEFGERIASVTKPFYEQVDRIRKNRIEPVAASVQGLFRNLEMSLRLCPDSETLNRLSDRILSLRCFKQVTTSFGSSIPQSYLRKSRRH
jgi:hypothetical protein